MRDRQLVRIIVMGAAGCIALAAAWNLLIQAGVSAPPQPGGNAELFAWWRPVEWQTASVHLLVAIGFLGFASAAVAIPAGPEPWAIPAEQRRIGPMALAIAGTLAAGASLIQLGGQQAVVDASTTTIDPGVLGTIGYTVDRLVAALQLGAYGLLAFAVLAIGLSGVRMVRRPNAILSLALGGGLLLLALLQEAGPTELLDPLQGLLAIIILPAWAWSLVAPTSGETDAQLASAARFG